MTEEIRDLLLKIFALAVMMFPLFATPFLIKLAGGVIGKVAGMVNNPNKGPFDAMRKSNEERASGIKNNQQANRLRSFNESGKNPSWWRQGRGARAARRARGSHLSSAAQQNLQLAQQQQIGEALKDDEGFARRAAGGRRASEDDIARAIAQGISALDEIEAKNLKANQTVLTNAKLDGSALMGLISGADQKGANGEQIKASQTMRMAAIATMASQGRQIDDVAGHVAASGSADLQKFFVGQVQSNYNAIKPRNGGMVDEEFLRDMSKGKVNGGNIAAYRVAAAGQGATKLNVETMASQDASYLKDLQTYLNTKIAAGAVTDADRRVIEVAKGVATSTARTRTNGETAELLATIGRL
ncbi:hypothetical protein KA093_00685 [Candidatus Saccharibacteria bacterium]|nr:hypothetical protein [Candidatus Saccharibacteria bacterium]